MCICIHRCTAQKHACTAAHVMYTEVDKLVHTYTDTHMHVHTNNCQRNVSLGTESSMGERAICNMRGRILNKFYSLGFEVTQACVFVERRHVVLYVALCKQRLLPMVTEASHNPFLWPYKPTLVHSWYWFTTDRLFISFFQNTLEYY